MELVTIGRPSKMSLCTLGSMYRMAAVRVVSIVSIWRRYLITFFGRLKGAKMSLSDENASSSVGG